MGATKRNGKIDLLKFIFSIVIVIFHFNVGNYHYQLFFKGYIAVEFFFVTSGFLFARSLSRIEYKKETLMTDSFGFMKKKFLSIFPYHFFFFLACYISLIVLSPSLSTAVTQLFKSIPDLFMMQMSGISNMDMLRYEWYISAMLIVMFILTPIAIKYRKAFLYYLCPIVFVLLTGWLYRQKHDINFSSQWNGFCFMGVLRAAAEICLGCICYAVYEKKLFDRLPKALLLITEFGIYAFILLYSCKYFTKVNDYAVLFLTAPAVTISFSEKSSLRFLNNRFIYYLGRLSLPIYLSQLFVRQFIEPIKGFSPAVHTVIYVAAVIAVSIVSMLLTDIAVKLIKNVSAKRREKTSA